MSAYAALADALLLLHVVFVGFVVAGGLLVLRWPRVAWLHVPAAVWGALVELAGWICPLTPLEQRLRVAAGQAAQGGDFIEQLLTPLLYPDWLTRSIQVTFGILVILLNAGAYALVLARRRRAGP